MKKYTIHKNCHYSNFIPSFKWCNNVISLRKTFKFTDSCAYHITEKSCVNKLFGFCFGFGVHTNSFRFGWTYNKADEIVHIWKYVYENKKLHKEEIYKVKLLEAHEYLIIVNKIQNNEYQIELIIDDSVVSKTIFLNSKWPFISTLGPYFGGNSRAPHTMDIKYEN